MMTQALKPGNWVQRPGFAAHEVTQVTPNGQFVRFWINGGESGWVYAGNYAVVEAPEPTP